MDRNPRKAGDAAKKGYTPPSEGSNNTFEQQHVTHLPQHKPILLLRKVYGQPVFLSRRENGQACTGPGESGIMQPQPERRKDK